MSGRELLPAAPKVGDVRVVRRSGGSFASRRLCRFHLRAKSRWVELGLDAIQPRHGFVFRVQVNRGESVWTESFVCRFALLIGLAFLTGLFQRQNQQRAVLRVIGRAFHGFAEISGRSGGIFPRSRGTRTGKPTPELPPHFKLVCPLLL